MKFEKWQALGNDYLILESQNLPWELNSKRIEWLCDPHFGIGGDGILLLTRSQEPEFVAIDPPQTWQAEALDPATLADIVRRAIETRVDPAMRDRQQTACPRSRKDVISRLGQIA